MPINKHLYPANWREISYSIRWERAKGRCEWCDATNYAPHPVTGSIVVLTVAHLGTPYPDGRPGDPADKMDCREENLAALCQRCHLNYDRRENWNIRRRNLALKLYGAVMPLFAVKQ